MVESAGHVDHNSRITEPSGRLGCGGAGFFSVSVDLVGGYQLSAYGGVRGGQWGTTVFLNDGTGAFDVVDGVDLLAVTTTPSNGQRWNLGAFIPTVVTPQRTEGIVFDHVGGCGWGGICVPTGLRLYKVVANASIGTGPGFGDSAELGVPGFNEFYYLRRHPDAADAVRRGEYSSGLAHYLAVGRDRNYRPFAPGARVPFTDALLPGGATPVRAAHIVELRSRINLLRAEYNLAPVAFSDSPLIPRQTTIKAAHILELRAALGDVYAAAKRTPPTYGEAIGPGASVRASQLMELRAAVLALE